SPSSADVGADHTIQCVTSPPFSSRTATDACDAHPALTFADVTKPGSCAQALDVTRTWTAKDACGNASTASQTIHVIDTTPPLIAGVGREQTIKCAGAALFSRPTARDA